MAGLEVAKQLDYIIFDKTGTLTKGEFEVAEIVAFDTFKDTEIVKLAAAVEIHSQHSIAKGIVEEAKKRKIEVAAAQNFKSYPGKGAEARVEGKKVVVGNLAMLEKKGVSLASSEHNIVSLSDSAKTIIWVAVGERVAGALVLEDSLREESKEAVKELHKLGVKTAMLTGDKKDVADEVGRRLGIDTIFSEVLPEQKVDKVMELQDKGYIVGMVGDGVNDAPSLKQAHVGIAIGAGTDVAIESAEIVLVKNNPLDVVKVISLSRKTDAKMKQNLAWATGYNILAIPAAAGVFISWGIRLRPEYGALLMSASSLLVVANALILKRAKF